MRIILFLIMSALLLLSACTSPFGGEQDIQRDAPGYRCPPLKEGRGIVADFVQYSPPQQVREGLPFSLGLVFANHFFDALPVDLIIQDTVDYSGFPAEGISETVVIDGALVENNIWQRPGCRISGEQGMVQLDFGPYTYTSSSRQGYGTPSLSFDDTTLFQGYLRYHAVTDASLFLCAYNPAFGGGGNCPSTQRYPSSSFGWMNDKSPLSMVDAQKVLIGSREGVTLRFTLLLRNMGGGYIGDDGTVQFILDGDGLSFSCFSEEATFQKGNSMTLVLDPDTRQAFIECETFLMLDRLQSFPLRINLQYPYVYPFVSEPMTIKHSMEDRSLTPTWDDAPMV
jgi:hypothetical protein